MERCLPTSCYCWRHFIIHCSPRHVNDIMLVDLFLNSSFFLPVHWSMTHLSSFHYFVPLSYYSALLASVCLTSFLIYVLFSADSFVFIFFKSLLHVLNLVNFNHNYFRAIRVLLAHMLNDFCSYPMVWWPKSSCSFAPVNSPSRNVWTTWTGFKRFENRRMNLELFYFLTPPIEEDVTTSNHTWLAPCLLMWVIPIQLYPCYIRLNILFS